MTHTPTPWSAGGDGSIRDQKGNPIPIYSGWISEAWYGEEPGKLNAALIARAVNAHDDLVEALKECLREHGGFTIKGECERRARAALAKAGAA